MLLALGVTEEELYFCYTHIHLHLLPNHNQNIEALKWKYIYAIVIFAKYKCKSSNLYFKGKQISS